MYMLTVDFEIFIKWDDQEVEKSTKIVMSFKESDI